MPSNPHAPEDCRSDSAAAIRRELPQLPSELSGNGGRERARHRFVNRTLEALAAGRTESGAAAEDWRRVAGQLVMLWQASRTSYRQVVADLEIRAKAEARSYTTPARPASRGAGPSGGELIYPWEARDDDWVAITGGPSGMFTIAVMCMPDARGVAQTGVSLSQEHLFWSNRSNTLHKVEPRTLVERLPASKEWAKAREQWERDHAEWTRSNS